MDDKKADVALLILMFVPVLVAICGLILEFNAIDSAYLGLVGCLFLKYFLVKE